MFGFDWKVKVDPNIYGGGYNWKTKTIVLGNKKGK